MKNKTKPLDEESWSDNFTIKIILSALCVILGGLLAMDWLGIL